MGTDGRRLSPCLVQLTTVDRKAILGILMRYSRNLFIYVALAAGCLAIYGQTLRHDFVNYDDTLYVTAAPAVKAGLTLKSLEWAFTTPRAKYFQPLAWLSHMLDCQVYGLRPWGHHLTSLLFHMANTLLLFHVLRRMTGAVGPSAVTAALFAVHPLHVESVAWVAERKDVLSTLFWLLAIAAYVRYVESLNTGVQHPPDGQQAGRRRSPVAWYGAVLALFVMGLMAKPMVVTLPFVLLLLDYWPLGRMTPIPAQRVVANACPGGSAPARAVRLVLEKVPLLACSLVICLVTLAMQQRGGNLAFGQRVALESRLANAVVAYVVYLIKTICPYGLVVYYPHPIAVRPLWQVAGAVTILAIISGCVCGCWRSRPYLLVGWLWYLGALVPVIEVVQAGRFAYADRYTYIPLIGVFMMAAWGAADLAAAWRAPRVALTGLAMVALTGFTFAAAWQTHYWRNSVTLFEHALDVNPNNPVAHVNLGLTMLLDGQRDAALEHWTAAIEVDPLNEDAYANLGNLYGEQGESDAAISQYRKAIQANPNFANAHTNLGFELGKLGRHEEAISEYTEAIRATPDSAPVHCNLAQELALAGQTEEAAAHLSEAVRLDPDDAAAHKNLADLLAARGRLPEAVDHYIEAIRVNPGDSEAYYNIGVAMVREGKPDAAITCFTKAIEIAPRLVQAHLELGNVLLAVGRRGEAANHYRAALEIEPDNAAARKLLDQATATGTATDAWGP